MNIHLRHMIACITLMAVSLSAAPPLHADDEAKAQATPVSREQADRYYRGNRYERAEAAYVAMLPTLEGADRAEVLSRIGYARLRTRQLPEAIDAYQQAIDSPDATPAQRTSAYMRIGTCQTYQGNDAESLEAYLAATEVEGADPQQLCQAWVLAARAYTRLDRHDEAIDAYHRAIAVEEASFVTRQTAWVGIGSWHQQQEEYRQAIDAYQGAVALGGGRYGGVASNRITECEAALHADSAFFLPPYVTRVSTDAASIVWASRKDEPPGVVTVSDGKGFSVSASASVESIPTAHEVRQLVRVEGLEPGTTYEYEARVGERTRQGRFRTHHEDDSAPLRFALYGDTQTHAHNHERVAPNIAADKPDFILHLGDCVERGNRWLEWKVQFFDPGAAAYAEAPIWAAYGNHDTGPIFQSVFALDEERYQDFRTGDLHVFILDSQGSTGGSARERQLQWLREALEATDAKWKIAIMHHPMIHVPHPWQPFGTEDFLPLLEEHGVDAVFTGHYHIYQRLLPLGRDGNKPIVHFTSGGGGGNVTTDPYPNPLVARHEGVHHHCLVTIDGDRFELVARDTDNREMDRFVIDKQPDGSYQDELMAQTIDTELALAVRLVYFDLTHPDSKRLELMADFTPIGDADASSGQAHRVTLSRSVLNLDALPANTRLHVTSPEGDSGWRVQPQALDLSGKQLGFDATQLDSDVPLKIQITLDVDGRRFQPGVFDVRAME